MFGLSWPPPAARGQEPEPAGTPQWPGARPHPNTCSEFQIFIAAGRGPQGADSWLQINALLAAPPLARRGRGEGGTGRSVKRCSRVPLACG